MNTKTQLRLFLTGIILFIFTVDLSAQMNFKDLVRHPVLTYGDAGEWDDGVVWNPAVIKDGDTLRMWYGGSHGSVWEPDWSHIGYAWSLDGVEWSKYGENPVLSATLSWEGGWVGNPVVIKDGDTLKMWYDAENKGYAESYDGINWTKHPEPLALTEGPQSEWDDALLGIKTVIKEDNEYKLWYSGGRPGFPMENSYPQVGLATSSDGINWIKYDDPTTQNAPYAYSDPVMKVGGENDWDSHRAFEPWVMETDTGYFMFYTGLKGPVNTSVKQQIGLAYSTDGIDWIKDEQNPIIKDDHSVVNWGRGFYNGSALFYDNRFHYWFACFTTPPYQARPQIGYAVQLISCLPEGIEFTSQAEIDSFQVNCNNCNVIEGHVEIYGDDITNLNGLSALTSIGNTLKIGIYNVSCPSLVSLSGLENLTSIGHLEIYNNTSLIDIEGLSNLSNIGGVVDITSNSSLTSLSGLEGLDTIMNLSIFNNDALSSLSGLNNLTSINGMGMYGSNLYVIDNDALINLSGLESLTSLHKGIEGWRSSISIQDNDALINIEGIENIESETVQELSINNNPFLSVCDVQSICLILADTIADVFIENNAPGCNSLEEVEEDCNNNCLAGGFNPYNQEEIDNFKTVYAGCTEIRGNVNFSSSQITNLDSLDVLKSINGNLSISGCDNLTSLSGLDSLNYIGGNLSISYNSQLSICDVKGICNYVASPNGEISIHDNATDCNSITEVENACGFDFVIENGLIISLKIHPNPLSTSATIEYELQQPEKVTLSIYNQMGKQVYQTHENQPQGKQQLIWNAEQYADGVYYYRLQIGDEVANGKMVKVR